MTWPESATNNYCPNFPEFSMNFQQKVSGMSRYVMISKQTWLDSSSARIVVTNKKFRRSEMTCQLFISENGFNRPSTSPSSSAAHTRSFLDLWIFGSRGTYIFSKVCWFLSSTRSSSRKTGALMGRSWVVGSAIGKDISHQRFCLRLHYHPTTKFKNFGIWSVALP